MSGFVPPVLRSQRLQRAYIRDLAKFSRLLLENPRGAWKSIYAMESYVRTGVCLTSADGDSWCGGACPTCGPEPAPAPLPAPEPAPEPLPGVAREPDPGPGPGLDHGPKK